tara:strand:- start:91 stop:651 length:561 start_codon:yes stop_codon:yes gene_type:complete
MLNNFQYYLFIFNILFFSCTLEKKEFDNPVDFKSNDELGIGAPAIVFYPLTQTKTIQDSVIIESHLVFKEDSMESFSGVYLQINFPESVLELDTIIPGIFITDSNQSVPLFNYFFNGENQIDVFAYFLDTLKREIEGTGEIARLFFKPRETGLDSIYYNLEKCELINSSDETIKLNGKRSAEIIIE